MANQHWVTETVNTIVIIQLTTWDQGRTTWDHGATTWDAKTSSHPTAPWTIKTGGD